MMLKYKPWSEEELEKGLSEYKKGHFSILDIELSGACNFNCVYCDTPNHRKRCAIDLSNIDRLLSEGNFEWVHICGLGEPTAGKNYDFFIQILSLCEKYEVKCSAFSNVLILTSELLNYIDKRILHLLFKYDSSNYKLNANLYCTSTRIAKKQYRNIKTLANHVIVDESLTNIGASIVPTKLNIKEIPYIVEYCLENNIYPLIGELENCGRGQDHYLALSPSADELADLKEKIESMMGSEYKIPICPAVVSGIHISHDSKIVVDQISGLTCPWFWLEEPKLKTIMKFTSDSHLEEITEKILLYRSEKFDEISKIAKIYSGLDSKTFGGCGGDINELLNEYIKISEENLIK